MKTWPCWTKSSSVKNSRIIFESGRADATVGSACSGSSGIETFPRRKIARSGIDSFGHLRQFAESFLRFRRQKKGFACPSVVDLDLLPFARRGLDSWKVADERSSRNFHVKQYVRQPSVQPARANEYWVSNDRYFKYLSNHPTVCSIRSI